MELLLSSRGLPSSADIFCTNFYRLSYENPRLLVGGPRTLHCSRQTKLLSSSLWTVLEGEEESCLMEQRRSRGGSFWVVWFFKSVLSRNWIWTHPEITASSQKFFANYYKLLQELAAVTPPRLTIPRFRETWMTLTTLRCVRVVLACVWKHISKKFDFDHFFNPLFKRVLHSKLTILDEISWN